MNVQNPILDVLSRDRSIEGMSAASRTISMAQQSFQNGASMALKMDQLLQQEEDRLYNRSIQSQKMMQDTLIASFNRDFKERSAKIAERGAAVSERRMELAENKLDETETQNMYTNLYKETELEQNQQKITDAEDFRSKTFNYTAAHNALSEIPKTKKEIVNGVVTEVANPSYYNAAAAMNKKFNTSYQITAPNKVTPIYNPVFTADTIPAPATLPEKETYTAPVTDLSKETIGFSDTVTPDNFVKAVTAMQKVYKAGGTISEEQISIIKDNVDKRFYPAVDANVKRVNDYNKDRVAPPKDLKVKPDSTDTAAVQGESRTITPAQYFSVPTQTAVNPDGRYQSAPNQSGDAVTILSDGIKTNIFKQNVYTKTGAQVKSRDMSVAGNRVLANPDYMITHLPDDQLLNVIKNVSKDNSLPQSYKESYFQSIVDYKPYLLVNNQFVSDLYSTVDKIRAGSGAAIFKKIKTSLASKLKSGVLDSDYVIPMQNMIDARVHDSIPNKTMEAKAQKLAAKVAKNIAIQKEGRTGMGYAGRGILKLGFGFMTAGFGKDSTFEGIDNIGIDPSIQDNVENATTGYMTKVKEDYQTWGASPTLVRMQGVDKVLKYIDTSFGQLTVDIEPWEELQSGLSRYGMPEKDVAVAMQNIMGAKSEDRWKSKQQRIQEAGGIKQQATVYGKFLEDLTMSMARQNETGTENSKTFITVEVNGKKVKIPKDTAYKLIGFDEIGSAGSNQQ